MFASDPYLTWILIGLTVILSWQAWERPAMMHGMIFNATAVWHHRQYYRLISSTFLHADGMHLIFNMITLYYMGQVAEYVFRHEDLFGPRWGGVMYILFYLSAGVVSSLYSLFKHRNHEWYNALGASGATSAITFAFVLIAPTETIYFFFALPLPAWLFGIVYLVLSYFLARRGNSNIGHDAHFWGGVYGFVFLIACFPFLLERFYLMLTGGYAG